MRDMDQRTLRQIKAALNEVEGQVRFRRPPPANADLRKRLDEELLAFRVARKTSSQKRRNGSTGWLRAVRQSTGVPVDELARKLRVGKGEIFRLEKAERSGRMCIGTLRRAADALGCELIYALAPKEGSLEDLAEAQREVWEEGREQTILEREQRRLSIEEQLDARSLLRRHLRRELRKRGIRVI